LKSLPVLNLERRASLAESRGVRLTTLLLPSRACLFQLIGIESRYIRLKFDRGLIALKVFFAKNWLTLATIPFSIFVGWVFFRLGAQTVGVSYCLISRPSLVIDSHAASSSLKVLDKDGKPVAGDVYSAEIEVWNSGNVAIQQASIRKPLTIEVSDCPRIIDAQVQKQNHYDLSNWSISQPEVNDSASSVDLMPDYFDTGFGCSTRLVYVGHPSSTIRLKGYITGGGTPSEADPPNIDPISWQVPISFFVLFVFIVIGSIVTWKMDSKREHAFEIVFASIVLVSGIYYAIHFARRSSVPKLTDTLRSSVSYASSRRH